MKVLLDGGTTTGSVAFVELTVAPQSFGAPPHIHHDEGEYNYRTVVAAPGSDVAILVAASWRLGADDGPS